MKRFASTILMTAVLMGIGAAYAATPAEMYDDVWKIVNKNIMIQLTTHRIGINGDIVIKIN